jgi:hypothetical protein
MNNQQIFKQEMQYIAAAIYQIRNAANQHGTTQDEHYDSNWMSTLNEMILKLRARNDELYKLCGIAVLQN